MFKKIISLALALMMIMSVAVLAASAAQVEIVEDAADTPVEVGGENTDASTGNSAKTVYFDANATGWNITALMAYVYNPETGDLLIDWGSKKKGGMTDEGNGVYSYDFEAKGIELQDGVQYVIIFNNDGITQTYDLLFDTSCLGDTAVAEATTLENPAKSEGKCNVTRWQNHPAPNYGPVKNITSIGNVVGEIIPAYTNAEKMMTDFLKNTLGNAKQYADKKFGADALAGKSDAEIYQLIIDTTAKDLGLSLEQLEACVNEAGATDKWDKTKSTLASSGGSGSTTPTTAGGSSGSTGTTGSTKTGSGSTSKTGQETTVLFIMLGVMAAAAGVIFFVRRRETV